jgi:glycosyltransferase involved in cell wall biosynthesis
LHEKLLYFILFDLPLYFYLGEIERMKEISLLLMSGLSMKTTNSFSLQLNLLSKFLKRRGFNTSITSSREFSTGTTSPEKEGHKFNELLHSTDTRSAILLGYPEQFPFLKWKTPGFPLFLWAQFSCTPDKDSLQNVIPVPLTKKTKLFLKNAHVKNVGPIIPHGVDTSELYPLPCIDLHRLKKEWKAQGKLVVGSVGAHTSRKQFARLIEAFANFQGQHREAVLIIKTNRRISLDGVDLKRIAVKFRVTHVTHIITRDLTPAEMRELYNVMDLYVNVSEWEGFCIPIIEAMACGIPVVTQPVQGPGEIVPYDELIIHDSTVCKEKGRSLYYADSQKIVEILAKAAHAPGFLKDLGTLGRKETEKKYDMRIIAGLWSSLIKAHLP